jgi:hypothetical protein
MPSVDTTDAGSDSAAPSDASVAAPTDDTTTDTAASASTDDQLLAEAASSLGGAPVSDATTDAASGADEVANPEGTAEATPEDGDSTGSSKKVIHPIDTEPKPSLEDLLAAEEGKGDVTIPAPTPAPVVDAVQAMESAPPPPPAGGVIAPTTVAEPTDSDAPAPEQKKNDEFNPHDISL